nr:hypothetical protein [Tanacetum cinerariifolium]
MTTPRPIPFCATTPRAGVFAPFFIIFDSDDEITTLPVRPAPPSPNRILALLATHWILSDDSSDEDLSETAESLHTQISSTSVVHPPSTRPLPTSPAFAHRPRKEISMPLGYRKSRSPSPPLSPSLLPSPPPATIPPPEHIKSVRDDIETLHTSLTSVMQETMTLRARVGLLEQHDLVTRGSLRIARGRITRSKLQEVYVEQEVRELGEFRVTDGLEIVELRSRSEYAKSCLERIHERQTGDGARMTDMTEKDIETLRTRAETAEQRAETLHVSLRAARMDEPSRVVDMILVGAKYPRLGDMKGLTNRDEHPPHVVHHENSHPSHVVVGF